MFLSFYGLREQPFGVTPDPRYLYLTPTHREALASLYYGIQMGRGFLALIAKPGTGKTTLLWHLLKKFEGSACTAFLFQTQCNSREFMGYLLSELGHEHYGHDFVRMHEEFNKNLLRELRAGKRFILVVDEAQNLNPSVLETVRLLSDFETPRAKLLQIILAGQPELADKLSSPAMDPLRQRISMLNSLAPLTPEEAGQYIDHRLRVAGYNGGPLFTSEARSLIAELSEGIPRNINNCCFNALSLGFALKRKTIDSAIMQEVAADRNFTQLVSDHASTERVRGQNVDALGSSLSTPAAGDSFSGATWALGNSEQKKEPLIGEDWTIPPAPLSGLPKVSATEPHAGVPVTTKQSDRQYFTHGGTYLWIGVCALIVAICDLFLPWPQGRGLVAADSAVLSRPVRAIVRTQPVVQDDHGRKAVIHDRDHDHGSKAKNWAPVHQQDATKATSSLSSPGRRMKTDTRPQPSRAAVEQSLQQPEARHIK